MVESNPDDAFLIRRALGQVAFCTSFLCRSVPEAKAYLSRDGAFKDAENYPTPDAILTEIRLGLDSGYDLLKWVRANNAFDHLKLYVIAGVLSPDDRELLLSIGVKRASEKPADQVELKAFLQEIAQEICGS